MLPAVQLRADNDRTADEIALLAQAGVGDREAFRALYERYSGPLFSLAVHMVGDAAEAEDLLQETFVKLWHHAPEYDPRLSRPFSWATTVLRRTCIDHLRRRQRHPVLVPLPEEDGFLVASESPRETAISRDEARRVRDALARVPVAQRAALELTLFSGLTQQEIAQRLDQPLGTVKSWIRRGLLDLRETLNPLQP